MESKPWAVFSNVSDALHHADVLSEREGRPFKIHKPRKDNVTFTVVEDLEASRSTLPPEENEICVSEETDDFVPIGGRVRSTPPVLHNGIELESSPTIVCGVEGFYDGEG